MPTVTLDVQIQADVDRVWAAVVDIERYPEVMDCVRWVKVVEFDQPTSRHSGWSIILKGSILQWEERETIDHDRKVMSFVQLSGDMETFVGSWTVTELEPGLTGVVLVMEFEIGIPLLADMLNPVAVRSLRGNCQDMLNGVEREAMAAAAAEGASA
jgi:ribosome-associated toxin RatA of RatAB toxin-antitoxin module